MTVKVPLSKSLCYDTVQVPFAMTLSKFPLLEHCPSPFTMKLSKSPLLWNCPSPFCNDTAIAFLMILSKCLLPWHCASPFYHDTVQVPFTITLSKYCANPFLTKVQILLLWHCPSPFSYDTVQCYCHGTTCLYTIIMTRSSRFSQFCTHVIITWHYSKTSTVYYRMVSYYGIAPQMYDNGNLIIFLEAQNNPLNYLTL